MREANYYSNLLFWQNQQLIDWDYCIITINRLPQLKSRTVLWENINIPVNFSPKPHRAGLRKVTSISWIAWTVHIQRNRHMPYSTLRLGMHEFASCADFMEYLVWTSEQLLSSCWPGSTCCHRKESENFAPLMSFLGLLCRMFYLTASAVKEYSL